MPSISAQFFIRPRSVELTAGPLKMFLPESPKVPGALYAKADVLKYPAIHWDLLPWWTLNDFPGITSARSAHCCEPELLFCPLLMPNGEPDCEVTIALTSQLPRTLFINSFRPARPGVV